MEIIVEGHKIDTKDIWKIEDCDIRGYDGLCIRLVNQPDIVLKEYTDNLYSCNKRDIRDRYRKLRKAVEEKWEQDKSELPVFKL